jgi:hypothetical protein
MMSATFERPSESGDPAQSGTDSIDRTFSTGNTCRLMLDNPRGTVRVTAWDRPEVHLVATKRLDASRARYLATKVDTRQDGDAVDVHTVLDPSDSYADRMGLSGVAAEVVRAVTDLLGAQGSPAEVDYDVHVPRHTTIELKGVSSAFSVEGTDGALRVRGVSGSIDTQSVIGALDLGVVSGEIDVRGVDGPVRADSVSGTVHVEGRVASLRAKSVSGDIEYFGPLAPDGSIEIGSVSGAASLRLPAETKATVSLRGLSSDVHCELPVSVDRDRRGPGTREWSGRINGGGSAITFRTVSGSLRLAELAGSAPFTEPVRASEPTSAVPNSVAPEPVVPDAPVIPASAVKVEETESPAAPDETAAMRILQALERGELNVEEALRQIDALRLKTS